MFKFILSIFLLLGYSLVIDNAILYAKGDKNLENKKIIAAHNENKEKEVIEVWLYDYPMADVQFLVHSQVLAIKNRNPLNVKMIAPNKPWLGQISIDSHGHAIFSTFSYGIRAAAMTLKSYALKYGINTVEDIILRFTEATPEQTYSYILYVSQKLGVKPQQKINIKKQLPLLLRHMSKYECGIDLPDSLFAPYDILAEM